MAVTAPAAPVRAVPGGSEEHSDAHAAWHSLDEPHALSLLGVDRGGLSSAEAARRLAEHGPNRLDAAAGPGRLRLFWRQIADPLIYALLASAALAIAFGDFVDGAVVLAVVAVNATRTRPLREIGWTTNRYVFAGIALLLVLHAGFVYLPIMHDLFGSAPLDAAAWAEAALAASIVVPAVAAEKAWRRRFPGAAPGRVVSPDGRRSPAPRATAGPSQ
jgi:magnesium-transporting ATPase (P-type)